MVMSLGSQRGLTLLETLIAAFILLFVLLSMISSYALGRRDIDQEEIKRKATSLAMDRLEHVRSRYANELFGVGNAWGNITKAEIDTTYVLEGTTFDLFSTVLDSTNTTGTKIVTVDVSWTAWRHNKTPVTRTVRATTDIAYALPLP